LSAKLSLLEVNASSETSYSNHPNFISISIIIDKNESFDELYSWLRSLNYTKFIFVIYSFPSESYILGNLTRFNNLTQYGEIIPRLPYYQQYDPSERERLIDDEIENYSQVGYPPKGAMDFVPDTHSANYALLKGIEYIQGYCFDQWNIDCITERGGFQMPYYASSTHILVPSATSGGIVVLPHSTWDWASSFTSPEPAGHNLQAHVPNLMTIFNQNNTLAKNYLLSFIDRTMLGSSPFGFFNFQFEWSWTLSEGYKDVARDWIMTLITKYPDCLVTYEEFVGWFRSNYTSTPEYRIDFVSPYDQQHIEWYYSQRIRVARNWTETGGYVVSYVDYTTQKPDKCLTQTKTINWSGPKNDPSNCIDDSVTFYVDALGGGYLRAPISTEAIPYNGDLKDFNVYFDYIQDNSILTVLYVLGGLIVILVSTTICLAVEIRRLKADHKHTSARK
jgi:hypothetical protein